jgi:cell division ATPase FtsA
MIAAIFFGGEKISITVATPDVNSTFKRNAYAEVGYSGIVDGEFVDEGEIPDAIETLVTSIPMKRVSKVVIGVPSPFISFAVETVHKDFDTARKVTKKDIEWLCGDGNPIYFRIDDASPVLNALGFVCEQRLEANVSYLKIAPQFGEPIKNCARVFKKFQSVELLPIIKAEANYLIDHAVRDRTAVIISSKLLSISVAVVVGDEICAIETFDSGPANMVTDLMECHKIDYPTARARFENYILNSMGLSVEELGILGADSAILKARVEDTAELIRDAIKRFDGELLTKSKIYITGGNIDAVPGAVEIFDKTFGVRIAHLRCPLTETNNGDKISNNALITVGLKIFDNF